MCIYLILTASNQTPKNLNKSTLICMGNFNLKDIEKAAILRALVYHGGHRNKTCESLGISIRCLRNKLIRWGMADYLKFQFKMSLDRETIIEALKLTNGHRGNTCKALKISRKCLGHKLAKYGLKNYLKYQHKNTEI